MRYRVLRMIGLGAATVAVTTTASAATMHPRLAARLSGMGDHGTVNLEFTPGTGQVCWLFDLPMVKDVTGTAVHAGLRGPTLFELGMHYARSGCEQESQMAIGHLESKPRSYSVWVNTKGHPGELRGRLHHGSGHM